MLGVVVLLLLLLSSVVLTRQLFSLCRQPDEGWVWCKLTQMHRRLHHRNQFRKLKLEMHKSCFYQIFNLYAGEEIPEIERLGWIHFFSSVVMTLNFHMGKSAQNHPKHATFKNCPKPISVCCPFSMFLIGWHFNMNVTSQCIDPSCIKGGGNLY